MKKGLFLHLLAFFLCFRTVAAEFNQLKSINFTQKDDISYVELNFEEANVEATKFNVVEDKQILLDLKNVKANQKVMRAFDTSEFSGGVVFISAYKKPKSKNDMRVALQLRDNVRSTMVKHPNKIILQVENHFGAFDQRKATESKSVADLIQEQDQSPGKFHVPKTDNVIDILENLTLSGRKKYVGKKISFNFKNVNVTDILNIVADASGFNIIITDNVRNLPPLSLNLTNIPWDQALDTILSLNKLVAEKNGVILMVKTLTQATQEQKIATEAKKLAEEDKPLVTKVFPISYANTKDIATIVGEYSTPKRGKISIDERTNYLIVKDTTEIIEKIDKIIETLDTQTAQILIESKIVEVTEDYKAEIGLSNGLAFNYDPVGPKGQNSVKDTAPGFSFSTAPTSGAAAIGLNIERFGRLLNLDFRLNLMESETKGKIISSPKIVTQNKKKAIISTKDTKPYKVENIADGVRTFTFDEATASLELEVTPQVTNDGAINLEIKVGKEQFIAGTGGEGDVPPQKQGRNISTNALVDNGETIVIGGVYNYAKTESHSGVPFLKDIPLIGWLFRTNWNPNVTKTEMVIFLTPRIINQEESGISNTASDGV